MAARTVLITSASEHASPFVAEHFGRLGWRLALQGANEQLLACLRNADVEFESSAESLETPESATKFVNHMLARFGSIDAAWIRTGYVTPEVNTAFLASSQKLWNALKLHNIDMLVNVLQALLPAMAAAKRGQILVSTSATGVEPTPNQSLYSATRAAAVALVRSLGLEFAATGVTINAIATSHVDVPAFRRAAAVVDEESRRRVEQSVPMKRLGSADELAAFAAVLLDGSTRFQTGQCFSFSGGLTR